MRIDKHILNDILPLSYEDSVQTALIRAEEYSLTHIFVVEDGVWKGNISYYDLVENPNTVLGALKSCLQMFCRQDKINVLEAVNLFQIHQSNVLPIVTAEGIYQGYIALADLFDEISTYPLITELAPLVTLRVSQHNYSLAEITRIAESNNARLYGAFISAYQDDAIEVTLKLNADSLENVLMAYEKYGYVITYQSTIGNREALMKDRYEQLMKFINV